ncbi:MAG: hypothetical protein HZB98_11145, partial [Bacteroidia bacterium]|nr:hypothetical protein [Bacteroidia bacterium]
MKELTENKVITAELDDCKTPAYAKASADNAGLHDCMTINKYWRNNMKTTRNSSLCNGGAWRWQPGKRAVFAPSVIVLLMMILLSVIDVGKTYGQQGVGISENPIVPHASSILELQSTLRGFLAPRMTTAERTAIASPAQGLLVFDTTTQSFWYYNSGWKAIASTSIGTANQLLGMNSGVPSLANEYKTLNGSANILVTHTPGNIGLNTIQDIQTTSSPTFNALTVSGLTPNRGVYTNGTSTLTTVAPSSGVLGYWNRDNILGLLTPSNSGDDVSTTGGGEITSSGLLTGNAGFTVTDGATQTNILNNIINIGNSPTDAVDITGATNLNGGNVTIADGATTTNIENNTINIGNNATDALDITAVTNINGGNLTVDAPQTDINSNMINVGNAATDAIDITGVTNLNGGNVTIADGATVTNIDNNTINIGNANTDVIDITGVTNINGGNLTLASPQTSITGTILNVSDGTTSNIISNSVNIGNLNTDIIDITGITNLNGGAVTIASNLTLSAGATVNNIRTDVRATGLTDNVSLVTETGIRSAINSSVTADNGLNEDPDGNI